MTFAPTFTITSRITTRCDWDHAYHWNHLKRNDNEL